jgi:4-carboxymuconolactone decarboxylase
MKQVTLLAMALSLVAAPSAQAQQNTLAEQERAMTTANIGAVSPALARYAQATLFGDLWQRPDLSPRDRSIVTLAALIARDQTIELPYHINLALDHGVQPGEISEIITHLALYAGWPKAFSALPVAKSVFENRPG